MCYNSHRMLRIKQEKRGYFIIGREGDISYSTQSPIWHWRSKAWCDQSLR